MDELRRTLWPTKIKLKNYCMTKNENTVAKTLMNCKPPWERIRERLLFFFYILTSFVCWTFPSSMDELPRKFKPITFVWCPELIRVENKGTVVIKSSLFIFLLQFHTKIALQNSRWNLKASNHFGNMTIKFSYSSSSSSSPPEVSWTFPQPQMVSRHSFITSSSF